MKKVVFCTFLCLFSLIPVGGAFAETTSVEPLDQVVAVVNKEIIAKTELDKQEKLIRYNLAGSKTAFPPEDQFRKQVLDHLVNQKLQLQMAKRLNVEVDEKTINKTLESIANGQHKTLDELKKDIGIAGIPFNEYREQIKNQLMAERLLQQEVSSRIYISDQEVKNVLNSEAFAAQHQTQYHLQDILVALPDVPSSADVQVALTKANAILSQLQQGKDFQQVAMGQSNGREALKGGDLGWRSAEELPEVFAQRVKTMKVGEYVGPIRTSNGYHLLKLAEAKGVDAQHFITMTDVRHILIIKNALLTDEQIKAKLEKIRAAVEEGADFATYAEKNSQDPISASKGGSLGWVKPGFLVPSFEKSMNSLKVGELSHPIESEYGWHLIQVLGRKQEDDTTAYRNLQVRRMLFQRQYDEKVANWLQEMRQASYIRVLDKNV